MGLLDFFKKGQEKPAPAAAAPSVQPKPQPAGQPAAARPAATPPPAHIQEYVIKNGDSLSKIARQFYNDPAKWKLIYEANKDIIKNPDLIHPDQKIKIPKL